MNSSPTIAKKDTPLRRWLRNWGPALAWAVVIWIFSTELFNAARTGSFLYAILRWLMPGISADTLQLIHGLVRKCGHFTEYFVFSLLVLRGIRGGRAGLRLAWNLAALAIAAAYASLDEVHQALVPSRTASLLDVLINVSGATAAQVIAAWINWRRSAALKAEFAPPAEIEPSRAADSGEPAD